MGWFTQYGEEGIYSCYEYSPVYDKTLSAGDGHQNNPLPHISPIQPLTWIDTHKIFLSFFLLLINLIFTHRRRNASSILLATQVSTKMKHFGICHTSPQ